MEGARRPRTNQEWQHCLRTTGIARDAALADLRACLHRAASFYMRRHAGALGAVPADQLAAVADDAAQEAILEVLAKLDRFRGEAAFLTWASKVGVSAAAAMLRRRRWRDVSLEAAPDAAWDGILSQRGSGSSDQPEVLAQQEEVRRLLKEVAHQDLTEQQRLVVGYVLFQGLPPHEVAERLGISRGALYKAAHDARQAFKRGIVRRGWTCAEIMAAFATA